MCSRGPAQTTGEKISARARSRSIGAWSPRLGRYARVASPGTRTTKAISNTECNGRRYSSLRCWRERLLHLSPRSALPMRTPACFSWRDVERSCRDWLSRARNSAASRRLEETSVQHALWTSDFRSHALRCVRTPWNAGVSDAQGAAVRVLNTAASKKRQPLTDLRSGEPLGPRQQPGYYPGFLTLSQQAYWDAATRRVILEWIANATPIRFFK